MGASTMQVQSNLLRNGYKLPINKTSSLLASSNTNQKVALETHQQLSNRQKLKFVLKELGSAVVMLGLAMKGIAKTAFDVLRKIHWPRVLISLIEVPIIAIVGIFLIEKSLRKKYHNRFLDNHIFAYSACLLHGLFVRFCLKRRRSVY
jgi:hypothetical protein